MELKPTGEEEYPYLITFENDEVDTVRAVFREEMFRQARKGNTGSISDYDTHMGNWKEQSEEMRTKVHSLGRMIERLEDFHEATDDAIIEIAQEGAEPPFLNDDIILRRRMGAHALELANELREEDIKHSQLSRINADEIEDELAAYINEQETPPSSDEE